MKPNILFLLSDQHNPGVLGCEGDPLARTPQLDALARSGTRFANAYCQNPLCAPSRASILTGKYSKTTGIYDNQHILESNSTTIPRVLGMHGYRTCVIGKTHFNGEQFHGYQQRPYGDLFGQAHQPDPRREESRGEAGLGGLFEGTGASGIPLPLTQTEICVAESAKWLQVHRSLYPEKPFFLSVHFDKPHFPFNAPGHFFRNYDGIVPMPVVDQRAMEEAVPFVKCSPHSSSFSPGEVLRTRAAYYACVEWIDDAVGRILATLDHLGLAGNTLVVYSTDHGEMCGEHGIWQKTVFFDGSARVPLIIRKPGPPSEKLISEPVGLIDLFPTFCEAASIGTPSDCEGFSLLPLLSGGRAERDAIFCESVVLKQPRLAGCMIRTGEWKYNLYLDGSQELYNMQDDPGEIHNLAASPRCAETVAALRKRVEEYWMPADQPGRYDKTPRMSREKHFYPFSNQFLLGDGTFADARP